MNFRFSIIFRQIISSMNKTIVQKRLIVSRNLLCLILTLLPLLYLVNIAIDTSVDVPRWDDWIFAGLLEKSYAGTVTFNDLLAPQYPHRLAFSRIIILSLAHLTDWNANYQIAFNILLGIMIFLVLSYNIHLLGSHIKNKLSMWLFPLSSIFIFSLSQFENWFWGWQIAIFLNVLSVISGFCLLSHPRFGWVHFISAICLGIISTYSFINGLVFWPIGFFVILLSVENSRRKALFLLIWIIVSLNVIYLYYIYPARDPLYQHGIGWQFNLIFFFKHLANPIIGFGNSSLLDHKIAIFAMGAGLLGISVITGFVIFYYRMKIKVIAFWLSLALFSISSAFMTSIGRDVSYAMYSRYVTISYPFWLAIIVILFLFVYHLNPKSLIHKMIKVIVGLSIFFIIFGALINSFYSVRFWCNMSRNLQQSRDRLATSEFRDVSSLIETNGYWYVWQLHILKKRQLSVYRER